MRIGISVVSLHARRLLRGDSDCALFIIQSSGIVSASICISDAAQGFWCDVGVTDGMLRRFHWRCFDT